MKNHGKAVQPGAGDEAFQRREPEECLPEGGQVPGRGVPIGDAGSHPLDVREPCQERSDLLPGEGLFHKELHHVQPSVDLHGREEGSREVLPEPACPGRCHGPVQDREKRGLGSARPKGLQHLQVSEGHRVQDHGLLRTAQEDGGDMGEGRVEGLRCIPEGGGRGHGGGRFPREAEPVQRGDPEVLLQEALRIRCAQRFTGRRGQWDTAFPEAVPDPGRDAVPQHGLPGPEPCHLGEDLLESIAGPADGDRELPRGGLQEGQCVVPAVRVPGHCHQVPGLMGGEHGRIGDRPGGHHPYHGPLHNSLCHPGILHLVADGYPVPLCHQPGDVTLRRVVRDAGQWDPVAGAVLRAGGEDDLQFPGDRLGIGFKGLVEVPDPEEEDGI
ncbi:MAG: hypothetical protein H6R28_466, partial [Methanomicrobiales archaeon]|nr:hypothetical protein [Methanomicrobiales archaeon]